MAWTALFLIAADGWETIEHDDKEDIDNIEEKNTNILIMKNQIW